MLFIFATGVFTSSWIGSAFLGLGEYIIRKVPLVKHIYSAAKQVSAAVSPDSEAATRSFRECVLIKHPRNGEFAFAFITGQTTLVTAEGDTELFVVYVPTNHGEYCIVVSKMLKYSTVFVCLSSYLILFPLFPLPQFILEIYFCLGPKTSSKIICL